MEICGQCFSLKLLCLFGPSEGVRRRQRTPLRFTYEFDIKTDAGFEIKVDVDAISGIIEEANFELYEIGLENE